MIAERHGGRTVPILGLLTLILMFSSIQSMAEVRGAAARAPRADAVVSSGSENSHKPLHGVEMLRKAKSDKRITSAPRWVLNEILSSLTVLSNHFGSAFSIPGTSFQIVTLSAFVQ